jgi:outer membrane lipoprotein SlyB
MMKRNRLLSAIMVVLVLTSACSSTYVVKPLPFKMPEAYPNAQEAGGALIGARAYVDSKEAQENFGFDVRGAGMLPVEIVIDNRGVHPLEINVGQTFLEDKEGNLWPILSKDIAYDRATKYAQTKEIFKSGAYQGFLGAVAGAAIGAAVGIVSGRNLGESVGKGAVIGGVGGGVLGGSSTYAEGADEARHAIVNDLQQKALKLQSLEPKNLSYGFIFFPGEAKSVKQLRMQILEKDTGKTFTLFMSL